MAGRSVASLGEKSSMAPEPAHEPCYVSESRCPAVGPAGARDAEFQLRNCLRLMLCNAHEVKVEIGKSRHFICIHRVDLSLVRRCMSITVRPSLESALESLTVEVPEGEGGDKLVIVNLYCQPSRRNQGEEGRASLDAATLPRPRRALSGGGDLNVYSPLWVPFQPGEHNGSWIGECVSTTVRLRMSSGALEALLRSYKVAA